ncbi:MAG: tail fiber domain-containing protein [Bacteroidia bacterium]|nr:tail fiber domain-containing protein [Bacteroidia bacterium]
MKNVIVTFLVFVSFFAWAQIPQSFQYQAVIRDVSGNVLQTQSVGLRLSIIPVSAIGVAEYVETHTLTTNTFGIVSLSVGNGTVVTGNFSTINWGASNHFIKVEADLGSGYIDMGTTQLLSVPYAMYSQSAGNVDTLWNKSGNNIYNANPGNVGVGLNNPSGRMVVQGSSTALATDPLFEVKNSLGQTVFVVYQDSVNVFVNDDVIQSNRGGFAVSGRNNAKAFTNNYLKVTPDKTRIFLNEDAASDGFAVMGLNALGNKDFLNVSVDTNEIINPSQQRILWYPSKEAFLAGKVLVEHRDSIGINSFSSGSESKAIGDWSQALGFNCIARGNYSMAIGKNSIANASNSFAFGESAFANHFDSYALGSKAIANAEGSYALGTAGRDTLGNLLGTFTKANGIGSFAFGSGCVSNGINSISFGVADSATGRLSVAMGAYSKAYGDYSFAFGYPFLGGYPTQTFVTSANSYGVALGTAVSASGVGSIAMGRFSYSTGMSSVALGFGVPGTFFSPANYNIASGAYSLAVGLSNSALGDNSVTIGLDNSAAGKEAHAVGSYTSAQSYCSFAFGKWNSLLGGTADSWVLTDPLFVIGNGTASGARSNAVTILKNGNVGIGNTAPVYQLQLSLNSAAKPTSSTWTIASDIRLKDVKGAYVKGLAEILKLETIVYRYKKDNAMGILETETDAYGFSAQDVQKIFPEAVSVNDKGFLGIDIHPVLVAEINAFKSLNARIEILEKENADLKLKITEINELKAEIEKIKKYQTEK